MAWLAGERNFGITLVYKCPRTRCNLQNCIGFTVRTQVDHPWAFTPKVTNAFCADAIYNMLPVGFSLDDGQHLQCFEYKVDFIVGDVFPTTGHPFNGKVLFFRFRNCFSFDDGSRVLSDIGTRALKQPPEHEGPQYTLLTRLVCNGTYSVVKLSSNDMKSTMVYT